MNLTPCANAAARCSATTIQRSHFHDGRLDGQVVRLELEQQQPEDLAEDAAGGNPLRKPVDELARVLPELGARKAVEHDPELPPDARAALVQHLPGQIVLLLSVLRCREKQGQDCARLR